MSGPAVCVIGAGIAGVSSAAHLASRGCAVTVIEQSSLASGSSGLSVGVYTRAYTDRLNVALRIHAVNGLFELEKTEGLLLNRIGYVRLARNDATVDEFVRGLHVQQALGFFGGEILDPEEVKRLVPDMDCSDLAGAMFCRDDGYLDGYELCDLYLRMARSLGVEFQMHTRLIAAERLTAGRHKLVTDRGVLRCDLVVNAAGAWADRVGEMLEAPIPIIPQRHQVHVVQLPHELSYTVPEVMDYVPSTGQSGLWFRHERSDQLLAGIHTNEVVSEERADPENYRRGLISRQTEEVAEMLLTRLPNLSEMALQGGWAGIYPMSPDGSIIVGPATGDHTVIAAAGLGGIGIHLSPAIGRLVSDWVIHGEPRFLPEARALAPKRFELQ